MNLKSLPIQLPQSEINKLCLQYYINKLSLFGSVLRDDFNPQSDVDILVEFQPGKTPSFFTLVDIQDRLENIIKRKVDLRTLPELSMYFRDRVLAEALVIYDRN